MAAIVSPAEKVKQFPPSPGVYLMKDAQGVVLYIGKAKNLRNRAGHYFTKAGAEDKRTADLVKLIADVDFVPADSEVDALLLEARLVKDVRPRFNVDLKDDKTFPYLQIRIREEYPRVEFTRTPRRRGVRLYGPFTSARTLRQAMQVFWARGYEGATLNELQEAMGGIGPTSFYAAFGSKEELFREAVELYSRTLGVPMMTALGEVWVIVSALFAGAPPAKRGCTFRRTHCCT